MIILPAIDLREGKCVRLIQGSFDRETVYDDDPVAVAQRWESMGATHLHVVDLDGAKQGQPVNHGIIQRIAQTVNMLVEVGGGIRTEATVKWYLDAGLGRVILGTTAATDPALTRSLFAKYAERIVVGIDAREGRVAISGWQESTSLLAAELAGQLVTIGCRRFIFTDISRDGMLSGPNLTSFSEFARAVRVPVIASGGVSSIHDLKTLQRLETVGVEGAIIGKALYDGRLDLKSALKAVR